MPFSFKGRTAGFLKTVEDSRLLAVSRSAGRARNSVPIALDPGGSTAGAIQSSRSLFAGRERSRADHRTACNEARRSAAMAEEGVLSDVAKVDGRGL